MFLWQERHCNDNRSRSRQADKQTNVIELCLALSPMAEILLTFHKRNKISTFYKIQAYCSTFSEHPWDPVCKMWLSWNWGRTILEKLTFLEDKVLYKLPLIHTNMCTLIAAELVCKVLAPQDRFWWWLSCSRTLWCVDMRDQTTSASIDGQTCSSPAPASLLCYIVFLKIT